MRRSRLLAQPSPPNPRVDDCVVLRVVPQSPEKTPREMRLPIQTVISEGCYQSVSRRSLLEALEETGTLALARERAVEYAEAARNSLNGLERTPYAKALSAIPAYIIERDH